MKKNKKYITAKEANDLYKKSVVTIFQSKVDQIFTSIENCAAGGKNCCQIYIYHDQFDFDAASKYLDLGSSNLQAYLSKLLSEGGFNFDFEAISSGFIIKVKF